MQRPATQTWPGSQQPQPQGCASTSHWTARHLPSTQVWPQPQSGLHVRAWQMPPTQAPVVQPHVPPQPFEAPHEPSIGHCGLQQVPAWAVWPLGHEQVPPQPSLMPPRLPSAGQLGVQHTPMYALLPLGHGQVPPQPSSIAARVPFAGHVGAQQAFL